MEEQRKQYQSEDFEMKDIYVERVMLHLGCGENQKIGYINVDFRKDADPDVVYDLNKIPYKFIKKNWFVNYILAEHVLEHLEDWEAQLREWWLIIQPYEDIEFAIPHASCNWLNPYHKFPIGHKGLIDYYNKYNPDREFEVIKIKYKWFRQVPLLSAPIDFILNILPSWFVDRFVSRMVLGIEEIRFVIQKR